MDFQKYIPREHLENIYALFGIGIDDFYFRRHISRFWTNEDGNFINPLIYEISGGSLKISRALKGGGIQIKIVDNSDKDLLPLKLQCFDCSNFRVLKTFQKLMTGNHTLCRKCIAKKTQNLEYVREKQKKTNIIRYGGNAPLCSKSIRNKMKRTMIKNLGVPYAAQSEVVKEKYRQTCLKKWGVTNYLASNENLSSITKNWYSNFSTHVYDIIVKNFSNMSVTREKFFTINGKNFFVDLYDAKLKLVVECYGGYWHADNRFYSANDIIKFPGGTIKTAKSIWKCDEKRIQNLLTSNEVNNIVIIYEYDFIKKNDYMKPLKDFFNEN